MTEQKHVYVILTATESVVAKVVHLLMRDQYTHSALALDETLANMYSFSRAYSRFPFYGRFRSENVHEGFLGRCRSVPGKVIAIPVTDEQYHWVEERMSDFSDSGKRYGYNYIGMFLNLIGKSYAPKDRYTCSQFVSETLGKCGAVQFNRPYSLIRPMMLNEIDGEVIYEGELKEYIPPTVSAHSGCAV